MAFEFVILDEKGFPSRGVMIGEKEYYQIVQIANYHHLPLISRMYDYYADVKYTYEELNALASELQTVQNLCKEGKDTMCMDIPEILKLILEANRKKVGISGIAD